jgi:hypothetical protein
MGTRRTAAEQSALPEAGNDAKRTISVARRGTRFSRLKVKYPECALGRPLRLHYDVNLARELLSQTAELPSRKRDLLALLTEYRRALAALAAEPGARGSATMDNRSPQPDQRYRSAGSCR